MLHKMFVDVRRTRRMDPSAFQIVLPFLTMLAFVCVGAPVSHGQEWHLRSASVPGLGDAGNTGLWRLKAGSSALLAGTWNTSQGCQVYRSRDGKTWDCIARDGFGASANFCATALEWFQDSIYVGVWNSQTGAGLYRAADARGDLKWETITDNGFGVEGNEAVSQLCVFDGWIYAAFMNLQRGPQIWRSPTGNPDEWTQVNVDGWGSPANSDVAAVLVAGKGLYMGTETIRPPGSGCEIRRTDGALAAPYDQWQLLNAPGFGKRTNQHVGGMALFGGMLYAATWNGAQGFEVWRAPVSDDAPLRNWECTAKQGIADPRFIMASSLAEHEGTLFLGARGRFVHEGDPFSSEVKVTDAAGGALFVSRDGSDWRQIRQEGFAEAPELGVQSIEPYGGRLYIGTFALDTPAHVWCLERKP